MTTTATEERTWSTTEVAAKLNVAHVSVWRWAADLGHTDRGPGGGPGKGYRLTAADVATMHAWAALAIDGGGDQVRLRQAIAAAFQLEVGPYVVATPTMAVVCQTPEAAAAMLAAPWARRAATFINITGALS